MSITCYAHPIKAPEIQPGVKIPKLVLNFDNDCYVFLDETQVRQLADALEKHLNKEIA